MDKAPIKIPEEGEFGPYQRKTEERFHSVDTIIYGVVAALIITSISSLIAVGAIIIDQLHFNNETYRDYDNFEEQSVQQQTQTSNLQGQINEINQYLGRKSGS